MAGPEGGGTVSGDCMQVAVNTVLNEADMLHCVGVVSGQGRLLGHRFAHAWVETPSGDVIDRSNDKDTRVPKELYYILGNISPELVQRYARTEVRDLVLRHEHYGPWEPLLEPTTIGGDGC